MKLSEIGAIRGGSLQLAAASWIINLVFGFLSGSLRSTVRAHVFSRSPSTAATGPGQGEEVTRRCVRSNHGFFSRPIIPVTEKSVGVFRDIYITDQSRNPSLETAACDVIK